MKSPLDRIAIAKPCRARWDAMAGDDRKRFCGDCRKHVYDLSAMTREEAEALVTTVGADGRPPCVRLYRRADGTVMTADCPVGVRLAEKARARARTVLAAALALATGLFGIRANADGGKKLMGEPLPSTGKELMGDVAMPMPTGASPETGAPPRPTPVPKSDRKKKKN
jgi:hypothetical protein